MLFELILFLAILGMFIVILRKLPEALREPDSQSVALNSQQTGSLFGAVRTRVMAAWRHTIEQSKVSAVPHVSSARGRVGDERVHVQQQVTLLTDEALMREGDTYLEEGKLKEAERAFLRAVAKNPRQPKLYNRLGAIYLKQRNYTDALEAFQAARDLDATRASRHYNVALTAWHLGKRAKAKEAINEALRLDGSSAKYLELQRQINDGE